VKLFAVMLVTLTGVDNQRIDINPEAVVTIRTPRETTGVTDEVKCLVQTQDGKVATVIETCDVVRERLGQPGGLVK
jgi:hypothetical protein